jgi:hypothetical protein
MKEPSREAAKKLEAEVASLHAKIDDLVKERIYAIAAQISGAPVGSVKNMFVARCNSAYCRCRAIRNIASADDGI